MVSAQRIVVSRVRITWLPFPSPVLHLPAVLDQVRSWSLLAISLVARVASLNHSVASPYQEKGYSPESMTINGSSQCSATFIKQFVCPLFMLISIVSTPFLVIGGLSQLLAFFLA